jgi:hypothetical protein
VPDIPAQRLPYDDVPYLEAKAILAAQDAADPHGTGEGQQHMQAILGRLSIAELAALRRACLVLGQAAGAAMASMRTLGEAVASTERPEVDRG